MKLHLPKQLFTALLAAIALAAAPFSQAAEYTGTFGWAASDDPSTTDVNESVLRFNFADGSGLSVTNLSSDKSYKSTNAGAATNAFTPDQNIGNGAGNNWTLNFTYTFEDTDVASATLNSITFDAFLFNGSGNAQNADSYARPVTFTLTEKEGDNTVTVAETTVDYKNSGTDWNNNAELEFEEEKKVTLVDTTTTSTTKTYALTASNAQVSTTYGTFVGLRGMTFDITATIKSGANVTWTNGANATWSGESWQTAAGTIGTMADANVGAATFADAAGGSHTVTVDAAATATSLTVSSGNYTFAAGSYTANEVETPGALSVTNGMTIASGASATFNVATTVAGNSTLNGTLNNSSTLNMGSFTVEEGNSATFGGTGTTTLAGTVSNAGTLTFGSSLTVAAGTSLSLSGTIVFKDTIYNNGTLSLAEDTVISLDALQNFDVKKEGGSAHILNETRDSEGNLITNTLGNGFEYIYSTEYWLVKGNSSINGLLMGEEYPLRHVNGTDTYQLNEDSGNGIYFDSGNFTVYDSYYIKDGEVAVDAAAQELVQEHNSTYELNGGTMKITEGTVNTSDIAYESGYIKVASDAKLNFDAAVDGLGIVELLTGSVITYDDGVTPGTLLISVDGLDTGNVALTTSFKGSLELAAGTTFTLGCKSTGNSADGKDVNTKTITGFVLNSGSKLQYQGTGANAQFNNLTVQGSDGAATFKVLDTLAIANDVVKLTGTTTLDGNDLNLEFQYGGSISIESLAGTGKLYSSRVSDSTENYSTTISSLSNFKGEIEFSATRNHTVEVNTGNVSEGQSSISFTSLTAGTSTDGSFTFNVQDNTNIGTLDVVSGLVTVSTGKTLTLGGGTAEAPVTHRIGTLSAAEATVSLAENANLTLGGGTAEAPVTHSIGTLNAAGASTVLLNSNAQLNKFTKSGEGTVTLAGSGVYDLGGLGNEVALTTMTADNSATKLSSTDWTGTVSFSGGSYDAAGATGQCVQDINFNSVGVAGSSVEIAAGGVYGYLLKATTTFNPNIKLSGNLILQNGYAGFTYTFNGDFSGSGNFETHKPLSSDTKRGLDFVFAGDMSQWTGNLVQNMKDDKYSYRFAAAEGKNTTIANGIVAKSNVAMDVIVSNDNEVSMDGKLTAETGSTLKVSHEGAGNLKVKSVEVQGNGEVQVAGLSITATDSAENATMTAKADTTGALKYLAEETSFTIEDMTLTNTTITAATPTTQVKLQNVTASNVVLAKGKFTMGETAQVGQGGDGTTGNDFTTSLLSGITLANTSEGDGSTLVVDLGDLSCAAAMDYGKYDLSITLSGFTMGDYTQGLLFAADSWLGKLLSAQGATAYVSGAVETPAGVSEGGTGGVSVSYSSTGSGENVGTLIAITGLNVPEPTTATLSLLALAALAARRRRK